jgi:biopolymer transport protein ExbD
VFKKKQELPEANINIASIIDCFTVIITYLLSAASLVSITALEAGLISNSGTPDASSAPPAEVIELSVRNSGKIDLYFKNEGGTVDHRTFEQNDIDQVRTNVTEIKNGHPNLKYISLYSEDKVEYQFLAKVISTQKNVLPVVFVGGSSFGTL